MNLRTTRWVAVAVLVLVAVACGGNETSRERNARAIAGSACKNPGAMKRVGSTRLVCGATPIGGVWYETSKSKGKTVACKKSGTIRYKAKVLWVCGQTSRLKSWQSTKPLPMAMGVSVSPAVTTIAVSPETTTQSTAAMSSTPGTGATTTLPARPATTIPPAGGFTTAADAPTEPETAVLADENADPLPTPRIRDFDGPSIDGITVSRKTISPGDVFTVTIDASDPSGIESVGMTFNVGEAQRDFCGQQMELIAGNEFSGTWRAECEGPLIGTNGSYSVVPYATDRAGNHTNVNCCTRSPLRGAFTLSGATEDSEGPKFTSVTLSKQDLVPGDTFTVDVSAEDMTGIRQVGFTFSLGEQQLDFCGQSMRRVSGTSRKGRWTAACTVPELARNGTYVVKPYASDFADNHTNVNCCTRSNLRGEFTVSEALDDADGPTIEKITLNPTSVNVGDELTIRVTLRDLTGIDYVGFTFSMDDAQRDFCGQSMSRESGTATSATWIARCTVPVTAQPGTYLVKAYARDVLGNHTNVNCCTMSDLRGTFTLG